MKSAEVEAEMIDRRKFLLSAGATAVVAMSSTACAGDAAPVVTASRARTRENVHDIPAFEYEGLSALDLQKLMEDGRLTASRLVEAYLQRISAIDSSGPELRSVIEVNPDAARIASELDRERGAGRIRGPLHGIPILVKDNIDTGDSMMTSAGSLALADLPAPDDAHIVARLRDAGAILLGKTNLSEWANFRSTHSSSGWSGRGGQTRHPYVLDRNPCGSSSGTGTAIAADLATMGIGTETDGSIICPSSICGLVGLKPTVGLVSRDGIIPISASQDTAGPMARSVAEAAILLSVIAGRDLKDQATTGAPDNAPDYVSALRPEALKGARIGVARNLAGFHNAADELFEKALEDLKLAGAVLVDPANVPGLGSYDAAENTVLQYEFKDGLNRYLASRGNTSRHGSLSELIEFNRAQSSREMPWFGQEIFEQCEARGPLSDTAYLEALAQCRRGSRTEGLDAVFAEYRLDALVAPSNGPAWLTDHVLGDRYSGGNSSVAAVSGYPSLTVPMGYYHNLPLGLSFIGLAWSEATLLSYGYAYEQRNKVRTSPRFLETVG